MIKNFVNILKNKSYFEYLLDIRGLRITKHKCFHGMTFNYFSNVYALWRKYYVNYNYWNPLSFSPSPPLLSFFFFF